MRFYTIQKLGPKRSLTPEGFLLCEDVPVARTGEMLYAAGEVPVEAGPDGLIRISRTPEEVFRDETLASCAGKPVTLDHPDDFVTPATFSQLGKGVMLNIRRGEGLENDLILADLLITAQDASSTRTRSRRCRTRKSKRSASDTRLTTNRYHPAAGYSGTSLSTT